MANKTLTETFSDIAQAVRNSSCANVSYTPSQMATKLDEWSSKGIIQKSSSVPGKWRFEGVNLMDINPTSGYVNAFADLLSTATTIQLVDSNMDIVAHNYAQTTIQLVRSYAKVGQQIGMLTCSQSNFEAAYMFSVKDAFVFDSVTAFKGSNFEIGLPNSFDYATLRYNGEIGSIYEPNLNKGTGWTPAYGENRVFMGYFSKLESTNVEDDIKPRIQLKGYSIATSPFFKQLKDATLGFKLRFYGHKNGIVNVTRSSVYELFLMLLNEYDSSISESDCDDYGPHFDLDVDTYDVVLANFGLGQYSLDEINEAVHSYQFTRDQYYDAYWNFYDSYLMKCPNGLYIRGYDFLPDPDEVTWYEEGSGSGSGSGSGYAG